MSGKIIINFQKFIPKNILKVLYLCSQVAEKQSLKIFLIGGIVRDIILNIDNFDIDITVQGNSVDFAYLLEETYPKIFKIKEIHEKFKTAKVIFYINNEEIKIDLASARKESYPYPGSLPLVEEIGCELYEDVKRRDFSINSMALSLNKDNFGELIDYLDGYDDINKKLIRVLHPESFKDDPTRIIRALKFRVRFGYKLDKFTKDLQDKCLESGMFNNLCGERIKAEIKQTFNLNKSKCMEIFLSENIYRLLDKDIKISGSFSKICESIVSEYFNFINPDFIWLIYLGVLFSDFFKADFSKNKINEIAQNLYLSNIETDILTGTKRLLENSELIKKASSNFEIYKFFEGLMLESILILLIKEPELKEKINLYFKKLKDIKIYTTGEILISLGLKPGPVFKEILGSLLKAKLNGEFFSEKEEIKFLKKLITKK